MSASSQETAPSRRWPCADEKAIAKGHQYLTLVCDLDRSTVEYVPGSVSALQGPSGTERISQPAAGYAEGDFYGDAK